MFLKSAILGFSAGLTLLAVYFLVLTLVSGWSFAQIQFFQNWYWIIGLSSGFGMQISLFVYLKSLKNKLSGKGIVASGTASTAAMLACCSHYLANIMPFIGIAGFAVVVGQYQTELFIAGLVSNLIGIAYMAGKLIQFKSLPEKNEK